MVRGWVFIAGVAVVLGALAGCSSTSEARYIGGASPGAASPSSSAAAGAGGVGGTGLQAENGTDVSACADGNCEIAVTGTVEIPLEPRFGYVTFTVTFTPPNIVEFAGTGPDSGNFTGSVSGSGGIRSNDLVMVARTVRGKGAVIRFSSI